MNLINTICQILLTLFAFMAICITIMQISGKTKPKLKQKLKFAFTVEKGKTEDVINSVAGATIKISNLGMAPVYISDCGVFFTKEKHFKGNEKGISFCHEPFVLQSGESVTKGLPHIEILLEELDKEVSLYDKAYTFITCGTGKTYAETTELNYQEFKFEYGKLLKQNKRIN